jgi:hypothetical protein
MTDDRRLRYFEDDFELDGHAEGKAGHADHRANGEFVAAENLAEQIGGAVRVECLCRSRLNYAVPDIQRHR